MATNHPHRIRIGYDASVTLMPGMGGIARYTLELLRALVDLRDPAVEFVVLLNSFRHRPGPRHRFLFDAPNVRIVERRMPGPLLVKSWLYWGTMSWERLAGEECDVVHAPASYIPPAKCPLVVTVHDLGFLREPGKLDPLGAGYFMQAFPEQLPLVDSVITPSQHVAREVMETYGLAAERVRAVHSGIDTTLFCPGETFTPEELQERGIPRRFLFAPTGAIARKRPELLAQTAELLLRDSSLGIVAAGFPAEEIPYRHKHFRLVQNITDEDLVFYYRAASGTLLTTREEGFGFPLLESLACGTPVVCGRNSSLSEVGGEFPHYAEREDAAGFADAVRRLLSAPPDETWRAQSIAHAARFTWRRCAETVMAEYRRVAAQ